MGIQGSVAECGVYLGDFAYFINKYFSNRTMYLFDTFEGFDVRDVEKEKELATQIELEKNVLVLGKTSNLGKYNTENKLDMGDSLEEISKNIFTLLRKVDSYDVKLVIIEGVKKEGLGLAIMNRLIRACEHNYIEI